MENSERQISLKEAERAAVSRVSLLEAIAERCTTLGWTHPVTHHAGHEKTIPEILGYREQKPYEPSYSEAKERVYHSDEDDGAQRGHVVGVYREDDFGKEEGR